MAGKPHDGQQFMKIKQNLALSDSGFIFNPATGDSFSANPIGMEIIRHLVEGHNQKQITTSVLKTYQIEESVFEKDYVDFVRTLSSLKLTDGDEKKKN